MEKGQLMFDFDHPPSRHKTHAEKYTALGRLYGRDDVLPFWVADMEFATAPTITEALRQRVEHPIYGYTSPPETLFRAIAQWNAARYNLSINPEAVTLVPGVMAGVTAALHAFSKPGDAVVIQPPIYPPFVSTTLRNNRKVVENPLIEQQGKYVIDFDLLESQFKSKHPSMMLFCSPHNPVGRVWSNEELTQLTTLTQRYGVTLISDEIHADIVYAPHQHISALDLDEKAIVLNSVSKSFNVAGLNTAYALIADKQRRMMFQKVLRQLHLASVNLFGMTALEAAYTEGAVWLDALVSFLQNNRDSMVQELQTTLPDLYVFRPEGSYLMWLNFNRLGLSPQTIQEKLINKAQVALNDGATFSRSHEGYWRFNFAVPQDMLKEGLQRLLMAFD